MASPQMMDKNYTPTIYPQKEAALHDLCVAFITITGFVTACRFWSRATNPHTKFAADDWVALASWPLVVGLNVIVIIWSRSGLGVHQTEVPLGDTIKGLKLLYAGYVFYNLGITLIRCSVVLFYQRILVTGSTVFQYLIWATLAINVIWFLVIEGLAAFSCNPIAASWDKTIQDAKCLPFLSTELASGITSVLLDFWTLIIPIPRLWRLQMKPVRKILNVGIFFLGYCVIIFTIGRLVSIVKEGKALNEDLDWAFSTPLTWILCELSVASMSMSLPGIFHLVRRSQRHGFKALFNDREYRPNFRDYSDTRSFATPQRGLQDHEASGFTRLTEAAKTDVERDVALDFLDHHGQSKASTTSSATGRAVY